jgi:hypothetical protein
MHNRNTILDQLFFWSGFPIGIMAGAVVGFTVALIVTGGLEWLMQELFSH